MRPHPQPALCSLTTVYGRLLQSWLSAVDVRWVLSAQTLYLQDCKACLGWRRDPDGYLYIQGRSKEVGVCGV